MAKHYDKEFKENCLQYRIDHPELNVAQVCRNLGISTPTYYLWKNKIEENNGEVDREMEERKKKQRH